MVRARRARDMGGLEFFVERKRADWPFRAHSTPRTIDRSFRMTTRNVGLLTHGRYRSCSLSTASPTRPALAQHVAVCPSTSPFCLNLTLFWNRAWI
jgi:hypothetical protein